MKVRVTQVSRRFRDVRKGSKFAGTKSAMPNLETSHHHPKTLFIASRCTLG